MNIRQARTDEEIARTFEVMSQLRPHLAVEEYVETVRRMMGGGFELAFLEEEGEVRAVTGFRFVEMLHRGPSIYVDDLVTDERGRSRGYGQALYEWIVEQCRERGCEQLHLDSGVHRARAHRFYFRMGMEITSFHFAVGVAPRGPER